MDLPHQKAPTCLLADPKDREEEELQTPEDELMRLILEKAPKHRVFTAATVREWFRNKRDAWFRNGLADKISTAIDHLTTHNLLQQPDSHAKQLEPQLSRAAGEAMPDAESQKR